MIQTHKNFPKEDVVFRMENGNLVSGPAKACGEWRDNAGVQLKPAEKSGEFVRLWDEEHSRIVKIGTLEIEKLDEGYLRDTGTMICTTKKPKAGHSVINLVRAKTQRQETPKSK